MAQTSAEKLEHTEPAEWKATFAKTKRKKAVCPDRNVGESQGEREPHLGEREGDQSGKTLEERISSTVKGGRFQVGKKGQAKKAYSAEVEGSMSG